MNPKLKFLLNPVTSGGGGSPTPSSPVTAVSQSTSDEIDGLAGELAPEPPKAAPVAASPAPKPEPTAPKPAPSSEFNDSDLDNLIPKASPAPVAATPAAATDEPKTPQALREEYNRVRAELQALKSQTPRSVKVEETAEYKALVAEAAKIREEREQLASDIRFADYTKSPEFKEKHVKPINEAFDRVTESFSNLTVNDPVSGEGRPGTDRDALALIQIPNPIERAKKAKELFGEMAVYAMDSIRPVVDALARREADLKNYREKGGEIERQRSEEFSKKRQSIEAEFDGNLGQILDSVPELYGNLPDSDPDSAEFNANLVKAKHLTTIAFKPNPSLPLDKIIRAQAATAARAIGFERATRDANVLRRENAELKERLKKFETADPGMTGGSTGNGFGSAPSSKTIEQEIEELAGVR